MNIGIVCYPSYGGSGVLATELGGELAQRGFHVHFISYNQPIRLRFHENIFYHQVTIPQYDVFPYPPYTLALINKIAEVIDLEGLDIIHAHYAVPHSLAASLALEMAEKKGVGLVTTLHGTDITLVGNNESYFRLTKFSMEKSDSLTAVSDYLTLATKRIFNIKKSIQRIYNFVDTRRYYPIPIAKIPCPFRWGNEGVIVHISNFRKVKRVLDAVLAFSRVVKEVPARLVLIGDGPTRGEVQAQVTKSGLQDRVVFLGAQECIAELLSAADILLLPSEKESFGLVNIEAMACEVPVVATAIGGIPEVVEHGVTGYLYPLGDLDGMAAGIIRLLSDHQLRREMGRAGRRRVQEHFSTDKIIPQYIKLYQEVSARGRC